MAEAALSPVDQYPTLVHYNKPMLVINRPPRKTALPIDIQSEEAGTSLDSKLKTEKILNSLLPPRCWVQDTQLWQQTVSSVPANRQDVVVLNEMLDCRLQQLQASEVGICEKRREIYSQCFDEIIRQVTIGCTDLGMLLLNLRDEAFMTMKAYQKLYISSSAFSMRKALVVYEDRESLRADLKAFQKEMKYYNDLYAQLMADEEDNEFHHVETCAKQEEKYNEEVAFHRKFNMQLKTQLLAIFGPKK